MVMPSRTFAATLVLAVSAVHSYAANIVFGSGNDCTGTALYGGTNFTVVECFDLPTDITSALVSDVVPGQIIELFADADCKVSLEKTSKDLCYSASGFIGSFIVRPQDDITKDLIVLPTKLSNYTELALAPYELAAGSLRTRIATIAGTAAGAITFAVALVDCINFLRGDYTPLGVFPCAGTIAATILSIGVAALNGHIGVTIHGHYYGQSRAVGASPSSKRSVNGVSLGEYHSLNPVGKVTRPLMNGRWANATLYELEQDGVLLHTASFEDEVTGHVLHHIIPASQSSLTKAASQTNGTLGERGYDTATWTDGGIYMTLCPVNTGSSLSGISTTPQANYQNLYDQFICELKNSFSGSTTRIDVDIYNLAGTQIAEAAIVPYGASETVTYPTCSSASIGINPSCPPDS